MAAQPTRALYSTVSQIGRQGEERDRRFGAKGSPLPSIVTFAIAGFCPALAQQRKEPPPSRPAAQYSFAPIVKKAAPAVVNVYVRARVPTFVSPFADDPLVPPLLRRAVRHARKSACRTRWARA